MDVKTIFKMTLDVETLCYLLKMLFLDISNPSKRDFIVEEFLKTKRNIQQKNLSEKLCDFGLQRELEKLYKPITESQSA